MKQLLAGLRKSYKGDWAGCGNRSVKEKPNNKQWIQLLRPQGTQYFFRVFQVSYPLSILSQLSALASNVPLYTRN